MKNTKWRYWLALLLGMAMITAVAVWPVETLQGVNYKVSSRTIRVYEKVADFISRDLQTRRLVADIVMGLAPGESQALAILRWVDEHVRPTPDGFPVIDDHPLHIIIRGYGAEDQRTEAFALLASYAGMPSTALKLRYPRGEEAIQIALTEIAGTVYAFDVVNNLVFRDAAGALVPAQRLTTTPLLVRAAARGMMIDGVPYEAFFPGATLTADFARMEMQKPLPRLRIEVSRLIGADPVR